MWLFAPLTVASVICSQFISSGNEFLLMLAILTGAGAISTVFYLVYRHAMNQGAEPSILSLMLIWSGGSAIAICVYLALVNEQASPAIAASVVLGLFLLHVVFCWIADRFSISAS